ncbi:MAG TPA: hypothetical protein VK137_05450 [Planctomycetaceae bacterium]|nr:hypothetical protein [Planctomycetaceae bacterium]
MSAQFLEFGVFLSNLPIPDPALRSTDAPENNEQRLAVLFRQAPGLIQMRVPAGHRVLRERREIRSQREKNGRDHGQSTA